MKSALLIYVPAQYDAAIALVGSFAGIRGGRGYAEPVRSFLQDGRNDNLALSDAGTYNEKRDRFHQKASTDPHDMEERSFREAWKK